MIATPQITDRSTHPSSRGGSGSSLGSSESLSERVVSPEMNEPIATSGPLSEYLLRLKRHNDHRRDCCFCPNNLNGETDAITISSNTTTSSSTIAVHDDDVHDDDDDVLHDDDDDVHDDDDANKTRQKKSPSTFITTKPSGKPHSQRRMDTTGTTIHLSIISDNALLPTQDLIDRAIEFSLLYDSSNHALLGDSVATFGSDDALSFDEDDNEDSYRTSSDHEEGGGDRPASRKKNHHDADGNDSSLRSLETEEEEGHGSTISRSSSSRSTSTSTTALRIKTEWFGDSTTTTTASTNRTTRSHSHRRRIMLTAARWSADNSSCSCSTTLSQYGGGGEEGGSSGRLPLDGVGGGSMPSYSRSSVQSPTLPQRGSSSPTRQQQERNEEGLQRKQRMQQNLANFPDWLRKLPSEPFSISPTKIVDPVVDHHLDEPTTARRRNDTPSPLSCQTIEEETVTTSLELVLNKNQDQKDDHRQSSSEDRSSPQPAAICTSLRMRPHPSKREDCYYEEDSFSTERRNNSGTGSTTYTTSSLKLQS